MTKHPLPFALLASVLFAVVPIAGTAAQDPCCSESGGGLLAAIRCGPIASYVIPTPHRNAGLVCAIFGGKNPEPHVPWFGLPANSFAPATFPPAPLAPYTSGLIGDSPDNPALNGGFLGAPFHPNILRYWGNGGTVRYTIVVPKTVPPSGTGAPVLSTTLATSFGLTPPAGSPGASYTWQQLVSGVQNVFQRYANVQTAQVAQQFAGVVYDTVINPPTGYSLVSGAPAFVGPLSFIWPSTSGGPTGNGTNEIILSDQPLAGLGVIGGLASILFDPATGLISEADVILDVNALIQTYTPAGGGTTSSTPDEWTAIAHEIGHVFGLDHTNLHSGVGGALPTASYTGTAVGTRALYPATLANPSDPPFPAMVGFITHLGAGANHTRANLPVHTDDATGLSVIYPVAQPLATSSKVPLINVTASVRGKLLTGSNASAGAFRPNAWVLRSENLDLPGIGIPVTGHLAGTARNTLDPVIAASPGLYFDTNTLAPYYPAPSALGSGGTGDFSIDGVPATPTIGSNPVDYDVVIEDMAALGNGTGNLAEWFNSQPTVYSGNPLDPSWPPLASALTSNENMVPGAITGYPTPLMSLSVVQGSVITLNPFETNGPFLGTHPASMFIQTTPPGGAGAVPTNRFRELVLRPLVAISPRLGRALPGPVTITITVQMNAPMPYGYDVTTAALYINGAAPVTPLSLAGAVVVHSATPTAGGIVTGPGGGTPTTSTYTIPMASIVGATPANVPVHLTFVIRAAYDPGTGVPGPIPDPVVVGTFLVAGIGRNDVIL